MSKLTDQFKNTRFIICGRAHGQAVQQAMFTLGFMWNGIESRTQMDRFAQGGTIFVSKQCRMTYSCTPSSADRTRKLVDDSVLFAAVPIHKQQRRDLKKAAKKRKQLRKQGWIVIDPAVVTTDPAPGKRVKVLLRSGIKSGYDTDWKWGELFGDGTIVAYQVEPEPVDPLIAEGWIKNTGVRPDGKVEAVIFRDGEVRQQDAGDYTVPYECSPAKTVEYYRPAAEVASPVVTQEEMVADIVTSAGGVEIEPTTVTLEEMLIETQQLVKPFTNAEAAAKLPDTNPKKQYGVASIPLSLWSPLASAYGALSLYNGSLKYGRGNYKATPVEASIYIDAAFRHLTAWAEGEEFDPADGAPNLGGVLANIAILLEARAVGTLIDDRQLPGGYLKEREALKAIVKQLQVVHAGKDPRHYTIADSK